MIWLDNRHRGPVAGLAEALPRVTADRLVVAFADTWWSATPDGSDWVGVCKAKGGRIWDFPDDNVFRRGITGPHSIVNVCVGLYCFSDMEALAFAAERALDIHCEGEVSFAEMLNFYDPFLDRVTIPEWLDVGTPAAWRDADLKLRGEDD
jgi:hypothetical protein